MGSGHRLRSIVCLKWWKQNRSKQGKVYSATAKSDGSLSGYANGKGNGNGGFLRISPEDRAAMQIQKAFRAHRARKSASRFAGTGRSDILIKHHSVQKQTAGALSRMHSWCSIQAHIRNRRVCMVTEGRIRQKKLENQLKLDAKLHDLEVEWHNGSETMEEILSRIQQREEAAVKRERAMAYAFSHQWRANSSQFLGQAYYSICKDDWGWSWMERWIAARPWEIRVNAQPTKKIKANEANNGDKVLVSAKPNGNKNHKSKVPIIPK